VSARYNNSAGAIDLQEYSMLLDKAKNRCFLVRVLLNQRKLGHRRTILYPIYFL